jgi:hypothetical protein
MRGKGTALPRYGEERVERARDQDRSRPINPCDTSVDWCAPHVSEGKRSIRATQALLGVHPTHRTRGRDVRYGEAHPRGKESKVKESKGKESKVK